MARLALVLGLLSLSVLTLLAQPLDRALNPFYTLRKPSGPPPIRVEAFVAVGPEDSLEATYYIPTSSPPDSFGFPAMVFVHGFGLNKDWDTASAAYWGAEGYLSLCYSVRAHGNSTGTSSIMGVRERNDLAEVLSFVSSLPGVNAAKIGIQGGSQGGLHALWAVTDSLPVRAATADVIGPHWASDLFPNGCYRRTLVFLLQTATVRYDQERDTLWDLLRSDQYDALRTRFTAGRDLDTARLYRSQIPLVCLVKWQDHYFSASGGIDWFLRRQGAGKLYAGTGGHYSDSDAGEWNTQWSLIRGWHDHFVRGIVNGIETPPDVIYAWSSLPATTEGTFSWSHTESISWPPPGVDSVLFYLHAGGTLELSPPGGEPDSVEVENLWDGLYSFDTGAIEGFAGPSFEAALPTSSVVFESSQLAQDLLWVGAPVFRAVLGSAEGAFPLQIRIFEVGADGRPHLVNRVNFTARGWTPDLPQAVALIGASHAHRFSAGSRIRLELTNIDREDRPEWGNTPFVLPMFKRTSARVYLGPARAAWLALPIVGDTPMAVVLSTSTPQVVRLDQNFPNPFNPSTTLRFALPQAMVVRLDVVDVTGSVVAVLIDGEIAAGEHTQIWDASKVASGIYYARMQAGSVRVVRPMVVVR